MIIMIRIIFALLLIFSPVVACEEGNCWIQKYIMSQYIKKYSTYDISPYSGLTKEMYIVMHNIQSQVSKTELKGKNIQRLVKAMSYKEMMDIYPCETNFLKYMFFNTKMGDK